MINADFFLWQEAWFWIIVNFSLKFWEKNSHAVPTFLFYKAHSESRYSYYPLIRFDMSDQTSRQCKTCKVVQIHWKCCWLNDVEDDEKLQWHCNQRWAGLEWGGVHGGWGRFDIYRSFLPLRRFGAGTPGFRTYTPSFRSLTLSFRSFF